MHLTYQKFLVSFRALQQRAENGGGGSLALPRIPCETRFAGNVILMQDILSVWSAIEQALAEDDLRDLIDDEPALQVQSFAHFKSASPACKSSGRFDCMTLFQSWTLCRRCMSCCMN